MKRFTSKDLLNALELQVGDRVKFTDVYWNNCTYEIVLKNDEYFVKTEEQIFPLHKLLDREIKLLQRPKRVGDLNCIEYGKQQCNGCPIRVICADDCTDDTLYNKLELAHSITFDQEIYDLLKARLDKEVTE